MTHRFLVASLAALVCVSASSVTALADHRRDPHERIQEKAASLANHSRDLYYEVRDHYRGQSVAARLMSNVLAVHRSARRMHGYAAAHSNPVTLEREMSRLESAFHQVEDNLRGLSRHHGSHRHVRELMRRIDDLVHDIHDDIHKLNDRHFFGRDRSGPVHVAPAPAGGSGLGPRDWYFGGGGFTIRLGR